MSSKIHNETSPAMPMEMAEMTVNASGGLYGGSFAFILPVIGAEANCGGRKDHGTPILGAAQMTRSCYTHKCRTFAMFPSHQRI